MGDGMVRELDGIYFHIGCLVLKILKKLIIIFNDPFPFHLYRS